MSVELRLEALRLAVMQSNRNSNVIEQAQRFLEFLKAEPSKADGEGEIPFPPVEDKPKRKARS